MAKCQGCGKSMEILSQKTVCDDCEGLIRAEKFKLNEEEENRAAAEKVQDAEKLERTKQRLVAERKELIRDRLAKGQRAFLYDSVYIPVDSYLMGQPVSEGFNITSLRELGLNGWEIIQVIPKPVGVYLENRTLMSDVISYGGGIGGNVAGVYILVKKEVSQSWEADPKDEVGSFILAHLSVS